LDDMMDLCNERVSERRQTEAQRQGGGWGRMQRRERDLCIEVLMLF
jgi:hypothetical protein